MSFPSYATGLAPVLWVSVLGLAAYNLIPLAILWNRKRAPRTPVPDSQVFHALDTLRPVAFCLWVLGLVGRAGAILGVNSLDSAFSTFGTVGASLLVISVREKSAKPVTALVCLLLVLEVAWAFAYTSKTALIVPLVALVIRWILRHPSSAKTSRFLAIAGLACAGFLLLQPVKGISTAEKVTASSSSEFAELKGAVVSLLERFDGLSAVTDAYVLPPGSWLTPEEFGQRMLTGAVPKGPQQQPLLSTGQYWTQEVRAYSQLGRPVTDVSLAAGGTAEGFALLGWWGVVGENLLLAGCTLAVAAAMQSGRTGLILYSSNFVFSTVFYEQGLIGVASSSNKSLQVLVVGFVLLTLFNSIQKSVGHRSVLRQDSPVGALEPNRTSRLENITDENRKVGRV